MPVATDEITDEELARLVAEQEPRVFRKVGGAIFEPSTRGRRTDRLSDVELTALQAEQDAEILRILFDNPAINAPADVSRARVEDAARQIGVHLESKAPRPHRPTPREPEPLGPTISDEELDRLVERAKLSGYRGREIPEPPPEPVSAVLRREYDNPFGADPQRPQNAYLRLVRGLRDTLTPRNPRLRWFRKVEVDPDDERVERAARAGYRGRQADDLEPPPVPVHKPDPELDVSLHPRSFWTWPRIIFTVAATVVTSYLVF